MSEDEEFDPFGGTQGGDGPTETDGVSGQYELVQADGQGRIVSVQESGDQLELVGPTTDGEGTKRVTPRQARYLADITESMVEAGAITSAGGFVRALSDWADANRTPPADTTEVGRGV